MVKINNQIISYNAWQFIINVGYYFIINGQFNIVNRYNT